MRPLSWSEAITTEADPALANSDPLGAGWFFKVKLSNPSELDALMDETSGERCRDREEPPRSGDEQQYAGQCAPDIERRGNHPDSGVALPAQLAFRP